MGSVASGHQELAIAAETDHVKAAVMVAPQQLLTAGAEIEQQQFTTGAGDG